jgi:tetratricopeptide (TPR) repeat protein
MKRLFFCAIVLLCAQLFSTCASSATTAEEYFSIGMAYFELGKYDEAEKWLLRAMAADRTMVASQYNLGRLAYEQKRYEESASHFENILKLDPNNTLALQAAAYTRIRTGDIDIADRHYAKLMELVPESADNGYNHALVLYAMGRYEESEKILEKYSIALQENKDMRLLYARCQAAQNKPEAINSFSAWLESNNDPKIRYEYALLLERSELYARAMEELRKAQTDIPESGDNKLRADIRFALARILLVADSASNEGITELQAAVTAGFNDIAEVEALSLNTKISAANREKIRSILSDMRRAAEASAEKQAENPPENLTENQDEN